MWEHRDTDPDHFNRLLNTVLTPHVQEVTGRAPLDATVKVSEGSLLKVVDLSYGTDVVIHPSSQLDYYAVRLGHLGRAGLNVDGTDNRFSPTIVNPGQVVTARWNADVHARLLVLPRGPVEDAVRSVTGEALTVPVRFSTQLQGRAAHDWLSLVHKFTEMLEYGNLAQSPLALAHFESTLVHVLLVNQASTASAAYAARGSAGPSSFRRALAYCQEHVREPVSVADIAAAASVSVRTLQELFRRHLDTTPGSYLRGLRLAGAHDDLTAVGQGHHEATVTEIAYRWGFSNLGRFGKLYRHVYGRYPSETVRGRRFS